jgi:hypothetical protein
MADPTVADAILDRLVHNTYKTFLKRESIRKVLAPGPGARVQLECGRPRFPVRAWPGRPPAVCAPADVVARVVESPPRFEGGPVLGHLFPLRPDLHAEGIGLHRHPLANPAARNAVVVVVHPDQAVRPHAAGLHPAGFQGLGR